MLGRSGLLWRTLSLLCEPDPVLRRNAAALIGTALDAGATQEFLYALEAHPRPRVRVALARIMAEHASAELTAAISHAAARATGPRQHTMLHWLLRQFAGPAQPTPTREFKAEALAHAQMAGRV
jgi:hypothetical protein